MALFDGAILRRAAIDSVLKLNPRHLVRNPVIVVTEVMSILVTILAVRDAMAGNPRGFQAAVAVWLWLTVLFANFAEAVAEGRGKARAASLRASRGDTMARFVPMPDDTTQTIPRAAAELKRGDHVLVEANEIIPSDGEIVQGIASVNESAVTGESAPVIREAAAFLAAPGVSEAEIAEAAVLTSLTDETPEGRSILAFARDRYGIEAPAMGVDARAIPFTARTRISGMDLPTGAYRKGAVDSLVLALGQPIPAELAAGIDRFARTGVTPLAVAKDDRILGAIELKDIVKPGMRERFVELRCMGIRTVMVTGDNRLTAAAIAAEAGVDDFLAEANPQQKLDYIRARQAEERLVAMAGDGTNDAPALAQADVGLAMQTGTQAAREADNMVDLDSDLTKLIEVVEIGKQLLITRDALTTFSIANDVAKYFAILPAIFVTQYPGLGALNVMGQTSPQSAILSAVIFNALIIVALVPLALRGVAYASLGAAALLRRNLLIYGLSGLVAPFIGIKIIDLILTFIGVA